MADTGKIITLRGAGKSTTPPTIYNSPWFTEQQKIGRLVDSPDPLWANNPPKKGIFTCFLALKEVRKEYSVSHFLLRVQIHPEHA